ncbi:hypothetical protein H310_04105 [Aphanomyces invadans]|uniref:Ankyrin repeat-containing domain n=1 Tax=Aphanomyces invadans TaxID=157072 RepID=A0A024UF86_9STRA|nr:hypothetical protein H310_04105 [Aphanomyces invadans]ETW05071.1 hypothetical protein H310_04105 [Aphanomyces invadans]|eukprot:XP_008866509.1 hypothetical protein H310_04105 [Aphanomyces invadans]
MSPRSRFHRTARAMIQIHNAMPCRSVVNMAPSCFAPRQYTDKTHYLQRRPNRAECTKPRRRLPTRGAFDVLTLMDILLVVFDFQSGVYHEYHPLRQLGYFTLTAPPLPSTNTMDALDSLVSPWLANFTRSRMRAFIRSTDRHRHVVFAAYAAHVGHLQAVQILLEDTAHKCSDANLVDWAACQGHLHVIQLVRSVLGEATTCSPWAMDVSATNNHLDVLTWLYFHCGATCTAEGVYGASRHGHLEVLQWLALGHRARSQWFENAIVVAAAAGQFAVLQWLYALFLRNGRTYSHKNQLHDALASAMANDHVDIVQWMRRRMLPTGEIDDLYGSTKDSKPVEEDGEKRAGRPSPWRRMLRGMASPAKRIIQRRKSFCAGRSVAESHPSSCSIQ